MRIAISAGHGKYDPGAVNPRLDLKEHAEAVKICESLTRKLQEQRAAVFVLEYGKYSLREKIIEVNGSHAKFPIDLALEIHFNANEGVAAHGTEVLYLSEAVKVTAAAVSRELARAIGTFDRGVKRRANLGWLTQTRCPALVVEVLFLNNDEEAAKVKDADFADKAADGIMEGLSGLLST